MDRFIAAFPARPDGDLMLCLEHGVAYQADMSSPVEYNGAYFDKYLGYEGTAIALAINAARIDLVDRRAGAMARVVDVGIGSGEFIKRRRGPTFGTDINAAALQWLEARGLRATPELLWTYDAFTFWDSIEHIPSPEQYLAKVRASGIVFASLPIFEDLRRIRESKHYRPNEHFYYFTQSGFVRLMALHGFDLLEVNDGESRAGREQILSFAFRRSLAAMPGTAA